MANILEIILKAVQQGSGFKETKKDVADLDKALGGLNKLLGMAGLAVGAKELFDFGKASVDAALESATADAALQTALTSTGQATAEYKAQLDALATSLENTTMFTDEQVMAAEASLVTFRNIGQNVMPQVIATVADMGQKMGDMGAAAQLAGIALNAPEQAAARLQRQGIMLSQQQKEQIATFVEMGNIAGAQGVILDALNTKYGGQATAARDAAGGMQDWSVAVSRLQEEFGKLLLAIGTEAGVGGAATGLVDTLTEGSTIWAANVEQIGLFVDALNRANEALNSTAETSAQAADEVGYIQQIQKGWEIILLSTANAAIESTVGWDALAESYGTVQAEAAQAEQATREANQAIAETPLATGASAQALDTLAARWQGLANAQRTMSGGRDALETMAGGSTFSADEAEEFKTQQAEKEKATKQLGQSMAKTFQEAADEIGNTISGKLQTTFQEVFKLPEGATDQADEPARRLATVAAAGFGSEWLTQLNAQFAGQDFWAPMTAAMQSGSGEQLQAAATGILQQFSQGLITNLFDVNIIRAQVRAEMVQKRLREQLIEEVRQGLGTAGVAEAVGVVEVAAGNVGVATAQTETNVSTMAATTATAATGMQTSFSEVLPQLDLINERLRILNSLLRETSTLAKQASGDIGGLNVPAAGSLVPNGAQRRMGGNIPL